uniref:Uncharacterized protein n=1 Tax=Timema tahoe TaxID=61484 RepID=A0A7R9IPH6_9NEOP|nr:unnamed protein product [Timema tahoe]
MMTLTIAPEWTDNLDLSQESSLKSGFLIGWTMQPLCAKGKCAKPSKTTQNPKASNMVELTKIYFACYTKIHKSMSDGKFSYGSKNLKEYSDYSVKKGCRLLFTLLFWRIEMLTNNQINLTTAGNLIKKKAVDKAKESMAVLEICANKVGVQPNECLAGDLACNCVMDFLVHQTQVLQTNFTFHCPPFQRNLLLSRPILRISGCIYTVHGLKTCIFTREDNSRGSPKRWETSHRDFAAILRQD